MSQTIQFHQVKDRLPWSPCPAIQWAWYLLKSMTLHPWLLSVPNLWSSLTSWVPTEARKGFHLQSQLKNLKNLTFKLMRSQQRNLEIVSYQAWRKKLRTRCFSKHEPWRLGPRKHNESRCRCNEISQSQKHRYQGTRTIRYRTSLSRAPDNLNNKWPMWNEREPQPSRRSLDYRNYLPKLLKQRIWDEKEKRIKITKIEQWLRVKSYLNQNLNLKLFQNLK